jgi:regulator of sirC expression with transglutaminase-like and TPR domain
VPSRDPAGTLPPVEATEGFVELMGRPEAEVPLDRAALLIAAHAEPGLEVDRQLARLDALAEGCPTPTLDGLRRHLFVDLGFAGDRVRYHDPRNSFVHCVLDRRRGIPITLAVVTLSVGRRLGVPLDGVGMPGHFLLRDRVDHDVFVDPFAGGAMLDREGCRRAFRAVQGNEVPFHEAYLEPVGPHAIVARMLANLRVVYAATGDHASLVWVLRLRTTVPGVPAEERGELGAALAAAGDFRGAATELEALGADLGGALGEQYVRNAERLRARLN